MTHDNNNKFKVNNLVADLGNVAPNTDANLTGPWGIVVTDTGFWVADSFSGLLTQYGFNGTKIGGNVTIPALATPTGLVINQTNGFVITEGPNSAPSYLITCTRQGVVAGYNSTVDPANGIVAVTAPTGTDYTGLTIAGNNLYVADRGNGKIDVYNSTFVLQTGYAFADATLPPGYVPFNIANIDGLLYVSYAPGGKSLITPVNTFGFGYINIFNTSGVFLKRFVSRDSLNYPWAMIEAPKSFCLPDDTLLVGNFIDYYINMYDKRGNNLGRLVGVNGFPIQIERVLGLADHSEKSEHIFFASGPNLLNEGLIGSIKKADHDCDSDSDCEHRHK